MAEDVFCNQCGHGNPPGSNFCSSCGAPLARLRDDPTTVTFIPEAGEGYDEVSVEFGDMPDGMGVLVVKRGPNVARASPSNGMWCGRVDIPRATSSSTT